MRDIEALEIVTDLAEAYLTTHEPGDGIEQAAREDHVEALERVQAMIEQHKAYEHIAARPVRALRLKERG